MLIRYLDGARRRDLRVAVADPDATVADLAAALHPEHPVGPLLVDGRPVAAATPLDRAGIADGATVCRPPAPGLPPPPPRRPEVVELVVTAGPDSGRRVLLAAGSHLVGRARPGTSVDVDIRDATTSAHHARVQVDRSGRVAVSDAGSTNGTWLGHEPVLRPTPLPPGVEVRCGATRFEVRPAPLADDDPAPPGPARTRPVHRRPRAPQPGPPDPVRLPPERAATPPVSPVGVVALVASLAAGGVAVLVLHSW
ncbi:MAG: FHA domain-containing protein, partial [Actinobacteria bacterium]|nr:FHA domain-containing protein [Actinomycetota bacterium]